MSSTSKPMVSQQKNEIQKKNTALLQLREYAKNLPQEKGLIPLEDFFKNSEIANIQISPNGEYLAYLKPYKNRQNIHIRKMDGSEPEKRITNQTSRDIAGFGWKENDTLIFLNDFGGDENFHVFRVFASGEGEKDLTPFKDTKVSIIDFLDDISEDYILIETNQRDKTVFDAYRLNIKTGEIKMIAKNPGYLDGWMTDHNGKLRVATSTEGLNSSVYYRETEKEEFQKILTTDFKNKFSPRLFTFDNKKPLCHFQPGKR